MTNPICDALGLTSSQIETAAYGLGPNATAEDVEKALAADALQRANTLRQKGQEQAQREIGTEDADAMVAQAKLLKTQESK